MSNTPRRPAIMGILNLTPDSFSDGGRYNDVDAALAHVDVMVRQGADIIDIGGESTRPGAERVDADEQLRRTLDIVAACRRQVPPAIDISIDTTRARVTERTLDAGATMINDVSAGTEDPDILSLAAERKVPICLMHMRGEPATMQDDPVYAEVVEEVRRYLLERAEQALKAGVERRHIILDPGIGFGKTSQHNLRLLNRLEDFVATGFDVLLGASRKRFLGAICPAAQPDDTPDNLIPPTCAVTALAVRAGVRIVRVHDVRENRQAADTAWAIGQAQA